MVLFIKDQIFRLIYQTTYLYADVIDQSYHDLIVKLNNYRLYLHEYLSSDVFYLIFLQLFIIEQFNFNVDILFFSILWSKQPYFIDLIVTVIVFDSIWVISQIPQPYSIHPDHHLLILVTIKLDVHTIIVQYHLIHTDMTLLMNKLSLDLLYFYS